MRLVRRYRDPGSQVSRDIRKEFVTEERSEGKNSSTIIVENYNL